MLKVKKIRIVSLVMTLAMIISSFIGMGPVQVVKAATNHVVISQIYGGGGNSGAPYTNDFIELYNPTDVNVDLTGWSIQYSSATSANPASGVIPLNGTIIAHGYYLAQGAGGLNGVTLPTTADAANTGVNLSGTSGKVALVSGTTAVVIKSDPQIVDFIGYGTANTYEGGPAPAPSNTTSIQRKDNNGVDPTSAGNGNGNGWDTDNNSNDFIVSNPIRIPKNTSSPIEGGAPAQNVSVSGVSLDNSTLNIGVGNTSQLTATVAPANATNKNVSWSSDNTAVATVNNGLITAVSEGKATITVTTEDQLKTSLCNVTVTANAPPTNKTFDIVEITDFHGQLLDSTNTKPVGAALAYVVKGVKAANPDRTLIIGGGDLYQGTPVSNVLHGVPVQQVMSNIGMEVTALGNHEFDWGLDVINNETMKDANYSIVSANMYNHGTNNRPYAPYKIITKDGVRIAVIGAILKDAPTIIMPALVAPYDFRDPATEINACAKEIRDGNLADVVLATIHDGGSSLDTIVNNLHGVDAVFGGHTHTTGDVVNKDADGNNVPTLNAKNAGAGYIDLKITLDPTNKIVAFSPKGSNWNGLTVTTTSPTDPTCKKIVDDASAALLPIFNEVIGHDDVAYTSGQVDSPYGESQLGNWMADVVKNYPGSPADVGMVNNGGIRLSPVPAGDITVGTIFNIMPFDNTVCTTTMTGAQLKYIFEQAVQNGGKGIQISGVKFAYDSTKPSYKPAVVAADGTITTPEVPGQRVLSIVRESDGTVINDADILKVNAPDFVATGGDTFTGFLVPEIVKSLIDSHYTVRDALNADVRANHKITVVMNNRVDNQMVVADPVAMSIAEARTTTKTAVILTGTVSAVNGKNVFMQDDTAGICVYNSGGTTFTAHKGDKITVTGNLSVYNGLLEVTPTSAAGVVQVSTGNAVTPKEVTVSQITNAIQGQLIKVKNVTFTSIDNAGASIAQDSTGSVNVYAMPVVAGLAVGDTADITAAVTCYGTAIELAVDSAADVVKTGGVIIPPAAATISIVGTSDVHGAIYPLDYNTGLASNVGLAKVSTYVNNLRASNPYTMLIDAGDTIQGTPLVYYYNMIDQTTEYPMMKVMGAMGYNTWTLGNHEFNYGLGTLNRIIADAKKEGITVLSANTYNTADNTNFVNPYYTKTFTINGKTIKVGVLGLTTKTIPSWEDPAHYAGLQFNDLVTEAQKWVPILRNTEKCDVVIASIHSGVSSPSDVIPENQVDAVAKNVSGIDAILCGHTHTGKTYSFTNPDGKIVPVVEPKNGDGIFSQIDLNIDADGNFVGVNAYNVTLPATTVADPAILAIAQPYQDATLAYTNTVIGKSTGEFTGAGQLTGPTAIMELINKVQMNAANSQLSIAAPLSATAKIPQGDIKRQDIMGVYVYENFLYGVNMTGKQLKNWLEWSVRYYKQTTSSSDPIIKDPVLNIADYNLDQLYGATYDIDLTQPACTTDANGLVTSGNRIKNLKINGVLIRDTDTFKVAINNYRYNGGGGFMAAAGLTPGSAATIAATYYDSAKALGDDGQVRNMMFKYVQDNGTISPTNSNNWKASTVPVIQEANAPATISIVGTSDIHGAIYPLDYNTGLAANVGLAKVSTYVNNLRATNPNTMLIDAGDTIQGTPLVYYYNMIDQTTEYPMMKVMGAMGYNTWTLGNHEFNYGLGTLNRIIADAKKEGITVLSANTYNTADNTNFVNPYYIKTFNINGKTIKVGVLGLTTKTIPSWEDPAHYAGLQFNDLVAEAQKWVPILRNTEKCDVVIASIHSGVSSPSDVIPENQVDAVAKNVSGIDAILCGHTHTGKTYSFTNPDGKVVPVVEPKNGDGIFSQIDLNIDADGNFTGVTAYNVTLPANTVADPAILAIAQPYQDATLAYTNTVIGQSTAVFEGAKQLTEPSSIMELVNKVQLSAANSQLSIAAPLSLSAKIPQGDIKRQDIMGVYVYENFLYGVNLTGKQLKNWLEWSVRYYKQTTSSSDPIVKDSVLNIADYNLDQLYGATYDIDLTQAACITNSNGLIISGNRIKNLKINGVPIKDTDTFKVAINNYRYNGGGGFMAAAGLTPGSAATIAATYYDSAKALGDDGQVRNMMFKYVQDSGTISPSNSNNWHISTVAVMDPVQIVITAPKKIVEVGETTNITLSAKACKGLYGFDISFKYDNTLFDIGNITSINGFDLLSHEVDNNGNVRLIGVLEGVEKGLNGNVDLVNVELTAKSKDALASFRILSGSKLSDENSSLYTLDQDTIQTLPIANSDVVYPTGTDVNDLTKVAQSFGKKAADPGYLAALDMDKNGVIDIVDLTYVVLRMLMVK